MQREGTAAWSTGDAGAAGDAEDGTLSLNHRVSELGQYPDPLGLLKVKVVQTPARPARKGVPNPFRPGEIMDVAAKPARRKVKILPLKKLKAMIA